MVKSKSNCSCRIELKINYTVGWLYHINRTNTVRYVLGTEGHYPLICFGVNPSTAEPDNLDPTLKSVDRIARNQGFDSWIMLNLYPQRSTNPRDLHSSCDQALHRTNLKHIENVMILYPPVIWAAWGTLIRTRPYLIDCLIDFYKLSNNFDCDWVTFGQESKDGHPHHPLYLRNDEKMKEFDIEGYLKRMKVAK